MKIITLFSVISITEKVDVIRCMNKGREKGRTERERKTKTNNLVLRGKENSDIKV